MINGLYNFAFILFDSRYRLPSSSQGSFDRVKERFFVCSDRSDRSLPKLYLPILSSFSTGIFSFGKKAFYFKNRNERSKIRDRRENPFCFLSLRKRCKNLFFDSFCSCSRTFSRCNKSILLYICDDECVCFL